LSSAEFSQFIETGSTPSDVNQYGGVVDGPRFGRQFLQGGASRTVDALRIGIVFMHNPVKRIKQFLLQIHLIFLIPSKSSLVLPRVILSHKPPLGKNRSLFQPIGQKLSLDNFRK
jgi:hypothetical protein